jgi:hypothetical protein
VLRHEAPEGAKADDAERRSIILIGRHWRSP